eukprot:7625806-Alexandrium_andersonii.AAC.1
MRELARRAAASLAALQAQPPCPGGSRVGSPRNPLAPASQARAPAPPAPLFTADRHPQRGSASRGRP